MQPVEKITQVHYNYLNKQTNNGLDKELLNLNMDFQGHCLSFWRAGVKCFYSLCVRHVVATANIQYVFPFMW